MSDQDQDELQQKIDGFMDKLKHGKLSEQGSFAIASSTLSILRLLIEDSSWKSAQDLMASVRQQGRGLISRCGQTSVSSIGTSFFDLFWILNTRRIISSLNCITKGFDRRVHILDYFAWSSYSDLPKSLH